MSNILKLKRSSAAGVVPAPNQLVLGELAVNVADGRAYLLKLDGSVVEVGNAPGTVPMDLAWSFTGKPDPDGVLFRQVFVRPVAFPVNLTGSLGVMEAPRRKHTILDLRRNGIVFGTMIFAAGSTFATFIAQYETRFNVGDRFSVTATVRKKLKPVTCTLAGVH
ncbi:MAG: hypothetical protein ABT940_11600 [Alphaproteobacteria bacterium]